MIQVGFSLLMLKVDDHALQVSDHEVGLQTARVYRCDHSFRGGYCLIAGVFSVLGK
jgi:hypothetical protein